jgi:hypothetical protein
MHRANFNTPSIAQRFADSIDGAVCTSFWTKTGRKAWAVFWLEV